MRQLLQLDARDNALVALIDLEPGRAVEVAGGCLTPIERIPAKHKIALTALAAGQTVILYGIPVAEATRPIARGARLTTENIRHRAAEYTARRNPAPYTAPDVAAWRERGFQGYHRADGRVGTRNLWLVVPLVFCENRNVERLREALEEELGFAAPSSLRAHVRSLVQGGRASAEACAEEENNPNKIFPQVDGIRFLMHQGGCGGTRQDARALCGLLAGSIAHPNVAGATVLSLGCQNAQIEMLMEELEARDPALAVPVLVFDQQSSASDTAMMHAALEATFAGLAEADRARRAPAPIAALSVGLKCGGSDGFSGLSANPALGHLSDLLGALGGRSILAEFPELHGVEQSIVDRCRSDAMAERFTALMRDFAARARAAGSGFEANPSPGNIADGLTTDAIKSAGAAQKGGRAPIEAVLDYPEPVWAAGLNLLCTPGNDVEAVTAQAAAGANLVLFTTGLGTPTGSAIAPVVKIATSSELARRMSEIIDFDAGPVVTGEETIEQCGERLLEFALAVAGGKQTKAELLGQHDFIPWKRGVSL